MVTEMRPGWDCCQCRIDEPNDLLLQCSDSVILNIFAETDSNSLFFLKVFGKSRDIILGLKMETKFGFSLLSLSSIPLFT